MSSLDLDAIRELDEREKAWLETAQRQVEIHAGFADVGMRVSVALVGRIQELEEESASYMNQSDTWQERAVKAEAENEAHVDFRAQMAAALAKVEAERDTLREVVAKSREPLHLSYGYYVALVNHGGETKAAARKGKRHLRDALDALGEGFEVVSQSESAQEANALADAEARAVKAEAERDTLREALNVDAALIKLLADAAFAIGGTSEQHDALEEAWKAFNASRAALTQGAGEADGLAEIDPVQGYVKDWPDTQGAGDE